MVVDRFSKAVQFIMLKDPYTATTILCPRNSELYSKRLGLGVHKQVLARTIRALQRPSSHVVNLPSSVRQEV
jgi:hypothetical protein